MKILVVDDEIDQVETLKRGLRRKGYQTTGAMSAQEALDFLQEEAGKVDVVITDYVMPKMDGLELLRSIRHTYGDLPVIMMTAFCKNEVMAQALHSRCNRFIQKPFTLDQIVSEIQKVGSPDPKDAAVRTTP